MDLALSLSLFFLDTLCYYKFIVLSTFLAAVQHLYNSLLLPSLTPFVVAWATFLTAPLFTLFERSAIRKIYVDR